MLRSKQANAKKKKETYINSTGGLFSLQCPCTRNAKSESFATEKKHAPNIFISDQEHL